MTSKGTLIEAWRYKHLWDTCWRETNWNNHTPGTEVDILTLDVPDKVYNMVETLFKFVAYTSVPYDWLGLLAFVIPRQQKANGMWFCSEGIQEVLRFVTQKTNYRLTSLDAPGWRLSPVNLYDILTAAGWEHAGTVVVQKGVQYEVISL